VGKKYYIDNKEKIAADYKEWRKTDKGKTSRNQRYVKRYPERAAANRFVKYAIKHGVLEHISEMDCKICDNPADHYHHKNGYEPLQWLDVMPVCHKCHKELHRDNQE
jgi:hypothetical protein